MLLRFSTADTTSLVLEPIMRFREGDLGLLIVEAHVSPEVGDGSVRRRFAPAPGFDGVVIDPDVFGVCRLLCAANEVTSITRSRSLSIEVWILAKPSRKSPTNVLHELQ